MKYFYLDEVKINRKFEKYVEHILKDVHLAVNECKFYSARNVNSNIHKNCKNRPIVAHANVKYWAHEQAYYADIVLPPIIKSWEDMYLLIHEAGHVVNRHITDLDVTLPLLEQGTLNQEFDRRENEADEYVITKLNCWLNEQNVEEYHTLEGLIFVTRERINARS